MRPNKQRIAIAEYCGTDMYINDKLYSTPDYTNDLNAMHEAEKMLKGNTQWYKYEETLEAIVRAETAHWPIHATAAQRAEAFLRTIGKWEE